MSDVTLTENQGQAVAAIEDWFKNRTKEQQVFRVFGYAGTGKTTITMHAMKTLGLNIDPTCPDVRFAAFTGKAAYVMRKHGTPAKTIASLFYSVHEATEEEMQEARKKLADLKEEAALSSGIDRLTADANIRALELHIKKMREPHFGLNPDSEARDAKLIVLDEVSMVGPEQAADILSFEKPVLVLGDPGQLPPIKGEGAFTQQTPDVMLTEIHRQAEESAIIRLATMARNGIEIPYGEHSGSVYKLPKGSLNPEHFLKADQVICGKNDTRRDLNNMMRWAAGFDTANPYPADGEKIICLKNDNGRGLINGMFLELSGSKPFEVKNGETDDVRFWSTVKTEEGHTLGGKGKNKSQSLMYLGHFLDHITYDKERGDRDWKDKKGLIEATFGWAVTCHKFQGSQARNVIVCDDHLGRTPADRARWLYTGLTRAEEGLIILD